MRLTRLQPPNPPQRAACGYVNALGADGEAVNTVVAIDLDAGGEGVVLAEGHDFFAAPPR